MENNELNNENIENPSSSLQNYEIEVSDKKNFFSKLFDRLKQNKNQKLLDSGNYKKTTNRSISSLWELGNLRASLFTSLDNIRKAISERFSSEQPKNTLATEIIGENSKAQFEKNITNDAIKEIRTPPIIPNVKTKRIINNVKTAQNTIIEVTTINTSAINERLEKQTNDITESSTTKKVSITPSLDER